MLGLVGSTFDEHMLRPFVQVPFETSVPQVPFGLNYLVFDPVFSARSEQSEQSPAKFLLLFDWSFDWPLV